MKKSFFIRFDNLYRAIRHVSRIFLFFFSSTTRAGYKVQRCTKLRVMRNRSASRQHPQEATLISSPSRPGSSPPPAAVLYRMHTHLTRKDSRTLSTALFVYIGLYSSPRHLLLSPPPPPPSASASPPSFFYRAFTLRRFTFQSSLCLSTRLSFSLTLSFFLFHEICPCYRYISRSSSPLYILHDDFPRARLSSPAQATISIFGVYFRPRLHIDFSQFFSPVGYLSFLRSVFK